MNRLPTDSTRFDKNFFVLNLIKNSQVVRKIRFEIENGLEIRGFSKEKSKTGRSESRDFTSGMGGDSLVESCGPVFSSPRNSFAFLNDSHARSRRASSLVFRTPVGSRSGF